MAVQRSYAAVTINVPDGGRLAPDLPPARIGGANYTEKLNWRRENGEEIKVEGWDFIAPETDWIGDGLTDFDDGNPAEAIRDVRRPNGVFAIVGCGAGKIKYFNLDTNQWVTIGSGYSTQFDAGFRRWQIEMVADYVVFNNGRDLMCTWLVGDAAVVPLYEFREAGYASCGDICEFNGVLRCADILEINDDAQADVMNDPLPYKTIVDSANTTRINYRRVWSNIGDPRDFASTVPGSIDAGTPTLTLDWPMASFEEGDTLIVEGAGSAGGNMRATILAVSLDGRTVTLDINAATTIAGTDTFQFSALESIVGRDDLEEDGSAILRQITLKNQLISFKASGHVFQEYYAGDLETPFVAERVSRTPQALRFPYALVNVKDSYLLFPGDRHFYRFTLGSQELERDRVLVGAEKTLFFDRIKGLGPRDVWAADNACTDEIYFAYRWSSEESSYYGANRALAVCYHEGDESCAELDEFNFTCGATVNKPLGGLKADEIERWFLMGDSDGKISRHGRTNLEVITRSRYGQAFAAALQWGLNNFGTDVDAKYVRRFAILPSNPQASAAMDFTLIGAKTTDSAPVSLITKTLANPVFPGCANLHYRKPYFAARITSSATTELRISAHVWTVAKPETTRDIDRLA